MKIRGRKNKLERKRTTSEGMKEIVMGRAAPLASIEKLKRKGC